LSLDLIDKAIKVIDSHIKPTETIFITSSFGYQSSLLFFILEQMNLSVRCLFIKSPLSYGGIDKQRNYILRRFDIDLTQIDRSDWLMDRLKGNDFMSLDENERRNICKELKTEPLKAFIKKNSSDIWISAIRKSQTKTRESAKLVQKTDYGITKISPLLSWTIDDVQKVLRENNLRINNEYLDLCKINESKECGLHFDFLETN